MPLNSEVTNRSSNLKGGMKRAWLCVRVDDEKLSRGLGGMM